ncbi:hypothetical protein Purlil1_8527 [Purpureocillium lilacinum]|uniref:Golgi apparatus membrane protein TVP23 n=1 Tax=Purpureocillium lilacinum TaxID=33203 RepID=A0ABR0BT93_PURLI|nr:hypothetical protein Purlil1_8527 [Purpureocillium lilacinum]
MELVPGRSSEHDDSFPARDYDDVRTKYDHRRSPPNPPPATAHQHDGLLLQPHEQLDCSSAWQRTNERTTTTGSQLRAAPLPPSGLRAPIQPATRRTKRENGDQCSSSSSSDRQPPPPRRARATKTVGHGRHAERARLPELAPELASHHAAHLFGLQDIKRIDLLSRPLGHQEHVREPPKPNRMIPLPVISVRPRCCREAQGETERGADVKIKDTGLPLTQPRRIMIFIITILLLAADFYYLKNIAGRRLVGLRWWNEVDPQTGDSKWVFESSDPAVKQVNATDSRFFWLALYVQPVLWVVMAILALVRLQFLWLPLVVIALVLTIMNTLAFSRCDKFSQASNLAGSALGTTNLAGSIASNMVGRWFTRN